MRCGSIVFAGVLLLFALACGSSSKTDEPPMSLEDLEITMQRTACFGFCPVYALTVRGDGTVTYDGQRFVEVEGIQTSAVSEDQLRELVRRFDEIDFFSLEDDYACLATDLPSTITSISVEGRTKTVRRCSWSDAPASLQNLENEIDEVAGSARWVGEPQGFLH
jgi:hypothetical protein